MYKVLVIAYYFPPMGLSGVQRTLKFTKYMSKYNWKPTVLTTGKTGYYAHDLTLLKEAEDAGIEIIRTEAFDINSLLSNFSTIKMPRELFRKFLSLLSKTFFIPDNKVSWSKKAYLKGKEILSIEKFDVIFVSIPPFSQFLTAIKLKSEFNIPVIVDYRDLWFGNHFAFYPTHYHKLRHKKLEYKALRNSDHVTVVNRRIKEHLLTNYKFLRFEDITIIPHGFDPEDFTKTESCNVHTKRNKLKILYSGIFYENITPKYFFSAFKKLTIEYPEIAENMELHFVGHLRRENKKLVTKLNLYKFVIDHGYLDHVETVKKLMQNDVLWFMLGNKKNMDSVSVGKLFEYFGTRKPIIACVPDGASKNSANEYGATFITEPDNVTQIYETFLNIHKLFQKNQMPVPNEEFILKHDRDYLTRQLTLIFQFHLKEE